MVAITKVAEDATLKKVSTLAKKIWNDYYTPLIGAEQVAYMVEQLQSFDAMKRQVEQEGYCYYTIEKEDALAGYIGIRQDADAIFLSKLYLDEPYRGIGLARAAMNLIEDLCKKEKKCKIWLTVNKDNENTIAAYEKMGFVASRKEKADIGNGFFMDDDIMEKTI